MKNLITYLVPVLLFCTSFLGFSQEENNFDNLTSGKWHIASVEIENQVMDVDAEDHWMVFYENGLYQIMLDNEEQVGTWEIDQQNEIKFDVEDFNGDSHVNQLSDHELKFSISGYTLALVK